MSTLTGTAGVVRLILRRDRIRLVVGLFAVAGLTLANAAGIPALYPDQAAIDTYATTIGAAPVSYVFNGPGYALDTLGGVVVFETGIAAFIGAALMSMFLVGRHTRAEEESGRTELVRAAVVGRYAPVAAALIVVGAVNVLLGAIIAAGFAGVGLDTPGAVTFGTSVAALGLTFAAVTMLAAQITEHTRAVYGIAGAALGVSFVLRAVGDLGNGTLSWLSPIGWVQRMRPYAGERWWPLLLAVGLIAATTWAALAVIGRRDVGRGLVAPRPGRARASAGLTSRFGLALRLQRGALIGWTFALLLAGLAYGSVGESVDDIFEGNPQLQAFIATNPDVNLTDSFLGIMALMLAVLSTGFALQSASWLRAEETAVRAEPVLATATARWQWAGSHLLVSALGTLLVLGVAGTGTGLAYGAAIGDLGQVPRLAGAVLAYAPAVLVLVGFAMALFGLLPRATGAAWAGMLLAVLVALFAEPLRLPEWLRAVSPYQHVPQLPGAAFEAMPLLVLAAVAALLAAAGFAGFRRRDLG